MKYKAEVTIRSIGPEEASELLASQHGEQRKLRLHQVEALETEMRLGEFRLAPDAITVVRGVLFNGQHRLNAVVQSGKPQPFIVLTSTDEDLYRVIDQGMKRSVGDCLAGVTYRTTVPAAMRWVMAYDAESLTARAGNSKVVNSRMLLQNCESNRDVLEALCGECEPLYRTSRVMPMGQAVGLAFLAKREGKPMEQVMEFLRIVYDGNGANSSAATDLHCRLVANRGSRQKYRATYVFGLGIKALKLYLENRRIGVLKWVDGEPMPKL